MRGIEEMARELVKSLSVSFRKSERPVQRGKKAVIGKCPRCGGNVCEGRRKTTTAKKKNCAFVMWKNDRFFEERKTAFTKNRRRAACGRQGRSKKLYSPKTGKTYDGSIVLADTGGKYASTTVSSLRGTKELHAASIGRGYPFRKIPVLTLRAEWRILLLR